MIHNLHNRLFLIFSLLAASLSMATVVQAETKLKPYILASQKAADLKSEIDRVKGALGGAGFTVVGEHSPYADAHVIVVTSDALKNHAAQSDMGGYGAIQRVSVTKVGDQVQVAHTNPVYMANAYRMKGDLADVAAKLKSALGYVEAFGAKGLAAKKLRKYHYTVGMEYFDEPSTLGKFDSHEAALKAVEDGLAAKRAGVSKVYRVDIPGKQESVIGVAMTRECSGDKHIMDRIDGGKYRGTAHLPYEVLVSGNNVYALYARFRIAQSFPDLSMMFGKYSFRKIMCAPDAIESALMEMVTGKVKKDDDF